MRIKSFLLIILFVNVFCLTKVSAQNSMSVILLNGTDESFPVTNIQTMKFESNNLNVLLGSGASSVYNVSLIRKIVFKTSSGFNTPELNQQSVQVYPNPVTDILFMKNVDKEEIISIFSTDGRLVYSEVYIPSAGVNVSFLNRGLYVIKISNQAVKFSKL